MAFKMNKEPDFIMKNVSEDMIDMYLLDCMKRAGVCTCRRCRADVRAYALNVFPPRYVVTDLGDAISRSSLLSNQYQADIITAITKGILVVQNGPRHSTDDLQSNE